MAALVAPTDRANAPYDELRAPYREPLISDSVAGVAALRICADKRNQSLSAIRHVEINAAVDGIAGVVPAGANQYFPGPNAGRFQFIGETRGTALQQILDELGAQD